MPIPEHEAQRVARMLRRLPRDRAAEVLQERRERVGEAQFRQEAAAIARGAAAIDRMADEGRFPVVQGAGDRITDVLGIPASPGAALPNDPAYEEVLYRSGAEHPDSRYRRQLGRQR